MTVQVRNVKRITGSLMLECEADHPQLSWIPYTASEEDTEPFGVDVWSACNAEGVVIADADPVVVPVPETVTKLQLIRAMRTLLIWDSVKQVLADPATSVTIKEDWDAAREIPRADPLIISFAMGLSLTDGEVDQAFILAETL